MNGWDKGQRIYDQKGRRGFIGLKKSFLYENKKDSEKSSRWLMKEYSVDGELLKQLDQIKSKKSGNIQDESANLFTLLKGGLTKPLI